MILTFQLTSKITPLNIVLDPFPMMFSMSLINFSNFSGVILLRIPRTLLNTTSLWSCSLSWGSASRLTELEGGIHLDWNRIRSNHISKWYYKSILPVDWHGAAELHWPDERLPRFWLLQPSCWKISFPLEKSWSLFSQTNRQEKRIADRETYQLHRTHASP